MSGADPTVYLRDILAAIAGIREAVVGHDFAAYQQSRRLRRAVEREIEIISEASRRVPAPLKGAEPDIPWRDIAGIGNVLRHDYQLVSDPLVWNVVERHLGPLEAAALRPLERASVAQD